MNRVYIGLGSNIDPENNIERARKELSSELHVVAESSYRFTSPLVFTQQPDFLNGVMLVKTTLKREELKSYLLEIEQRLGRVRGENRYGPRTIDLDILIFNNNLLDPDVIERSFVRRAINELWPDFDPEKFAEEKIVVD